jgi:hypothetical protein
MDTTRLQRLLIETTTVRLYYVDRVHTLLAAIRFLTHAEIVMQTEIMQLDKLITTIIWETSVFSVRSVPSKRAHTWTQAVSVQAT